MNELLSAAARLGEVWSTSPVVRTSVAERQAALTHQPGQPVEPHQQHLQMFLTSGSFSSQPLLVGWWLSAMPQARMLSQMPEARAFLDSSSRTASAFLLTIEWLRSWLPGYPVSFHLPHLDPFASRVAQRGLPNQLVPWAMELRRTSLHLTPEIDDQLAPVLELDRASLAGPLLDLRHQLWNSPAWTEFANAHGALNDEDRTQLDALLARFRADCRAVAESASERLLTLDAARRAATARCEDAALSHPRIRRYYEAFRDVDRLIEAVGALLTQFAIGEGLATVEPTQVTWHRGRDPEIRFVVVNAPGSLLRVNQIVYVASPVEAWQCLARVEGSTVNWDPTLGESSSVVGKIVATGEDATPDVRPRPPESGLVAKIRRV